MLGATWFPALHHAHPISGVSFHQAWMWLEAESQLFAIVSNLVMPLGHLVESLLTCSFHFIARWVADALRRIRTTTEFFMARPILHLTCLRAVELPTYAAGASPMGVAEFAWAHIRKRRHRYQGKHVECYEWGYANHEYY